MRSQNPKTRILRPLTRNGRKMLKSTLKPHARLKFKIQRFLDQQDVSGGFENPRNEFEIKFNNLLNEYKENYK